MSLKMRTRLKQRLTKQKLSQSKRRTMIQRNHQKIKIRLRQQQYQRRRHRRRFVSFSSVIGNTIFYVTVYKK